MRGGWSCRADVRSPEALLLEAYARDWKAAFELFGGKAKG